MKVLKREGEKFEKGEKKQLWKKSKKVAKERRKYAFEVARTIGKAREIKGGKIEKVGGIFVVENNQGKKKKKKGNEKESRNRRRMLEGREKKKKG